MVLSLALVMVPIWVVLAEPARVADARARIGPALKQAVLDKGVAYPPRAVLLRSFKHEKQFEVWIGDHRNKPLVLLETFAICADSGVVGPKRKQGDLQVPEGVYTVDRLKPDSSFHLALHVDYPNAADRVAGKALGVADLGGDIMVHGSCVTIGCIPLEDGPIERVYLLVKDARSKGAAIPIHLFPRRLDDAGVAALVASTDDAGLQAFWRELAPIYAAFERDRRVPRVRIDAAGRYRVSGTAP